MLAKSGGLQRDLGVPESPTLPRALSRLHAALNTSRPTRSYGMYRKTVIPVPLEMRVNGKYHNVGFLALSGRCTVTSLTTAHSQQRKSQGFFRRIDSLTVMR